jgi:hypothetical protein
MFGINTVDRNETRFAMSLKLTVFETIKHKEFLCCITL